MGPSTDLTKPGAVRARMLCLDIPPLYTGHHFSEGVVVRSGKRVIDPRGSQAVWNHSPAGFNWGYQGSGPAQLALALLLDAGLPDDIAVRLHQDFKRSFVSKWPGGKNWSLPGEAVRLWLFEALSSLADERYGEGMEVVDEG